jgi:hypothetical protein
METLRMNRKERDRITIMVGIKQGGLTLAAAAPLLKRGQSSLFAPKVDTPNSIRYESPMPRQLRIQYEGAFYHLMNRGDRCEPILKADIDHFNFLHTLGETCSARLRMGSWSHVSNLLSAARKEESKK